MYSEKIYFTKDQLERFLQEQSEKDRIKFNNMYPDKKHIDIFKIVDECIFKITDEVFDIYWENKKAKEKEDDRKNGIVRNKHEFSTPSTHQFHFTKEELEDFNKPMTEEEEKEFDSKYFVKGLSLKEIYNKIHQDTHIEVNEELAKKLKKIY